MSLRSIAAPCLAVFAALGTGCAATAPMASEAIDFSRPAADPWSLFIVTQDADGDDRVTRIWSVPWDGGAAIRTGESRWKQNLSRGSGARVRVEGLDHRVRVDFVTNLALRRQIDAAFLAKYGWQERVVIGDGRAESADHYMKLTPLAPERR